MAPWIFFLLAILASAEPEPTRQNNQSNLMAAMSDMRRQSYHGFVILLQLLNNTDFLKSTEVTFLMPSDSDLSQADINLGNLQTFVLSHSIPAWLMINHMLRFPNRTMVPSNSQDQVLTITKARGTLGLYVNDARIISPNICQDSRISCHGISNVIKFTDESCSTVILTAKENKEGKQSAGSSFHAMLSHLHAKHSRATENKKKGGGIPFLPLHHQRRTAPLH
ncbi:PREDICTED: uncharacterized protein LOC104826655 [Tarenaya hassleriana]|uniref:uncharacterized protein LOC104826655 n=1 Tax=Tarenaya hassleriana TaxID=28532 RepID=UPI00053C9564|nr:PREDICTED: uncharacterized protein LOC104826655 [Tarenaya hassleriana]